MFDEDTLNFDFEFRWFWLVEFTFKFGVEWWLKRFSYWQMKNEFASEMSGRAGPNLASESVFESMRRTPTFAVLNQN